MPYRYVVWFAHITATSAYLDTTFGISSIMLVFLLLTSKASSRILKNNRRRAMIY